MDRAYKTVAKAAKASFIERKSEFIGNIFSCSAEDDALRFIGEIKKQHRKATHNCYAYILRDNNISRHSDDGEPSGSAGAPMLEVLKKAEVVDVCCVVTRYFGGILLGMGGLVRAYSQGTKIALDAAGIREMRFCSRIKITTEYSLYGRLGPLFSEFNVTLCSESFGACVEIEACVDAELFEIFSNKLIDACFGRVSVKEIGRGFEQLTV